MKIKRSPALDGITSLVTWAWYGMVPLLLIDVTFATVLHGCSFPTLLAHRANDNEWCIKKQQALVAMGKPRRAVGTKLVL